MKKSGCVVTWPIASLVYVSWKGYMRRNWDTIREILTRLEEKKETKGVLTLSDFPPEQAGEISYHVELLIEAGLVYGKVSKEFGPSIHRFNIVRLTWEGHELLDAIRSDTVWEKTKKAFSSQGISMTFDLVKQVAVDIASACLKSTISS